LRSESDYSEDEYTIQSQPNRMMITVKLIQRKELLVGKWNEWAQKLPFLRNER